MVDAQPTSSAPPAAAADGAAAHHDACPGPAARQPLSCTRIVDAAVRYVDQDCLESLSMRRLGAELGVEAMSLYRYFPSKAALLDAVVCRMLSGVALPAEPGDAPVAAAPIAEPAAWEDAVREYASSFRAVCAAHPRLLPLLATLGPTNPTLRRMESRMVDLWREAGFDPATAANAQVALQGYLTGSCLQGAGTPSADAAFTLGLDAIVVGLRGRLASTTAPA